MQNIQTGQWRRYCYDSLSKMKEKAVQINNNNDVSTKTFGWKRKDYYDYYYYHNQNKMKEKVGKINKKKQKHYES